MLPMELRKESFDFIHEIQDIINIYIQDQPLIYEHIYHLYSNESSPICQKYDKILEIIHLNSSFQQQSTLHTIKNTDDILSIQIQTENINDSNINELNINEQNINNAYQHVIQENQKRIEFEQQRKSTLMNNSNLLWSNIELTRMQNSP